MVVKKLLGESPDNSPNLKFLSIDGEGVYEALVLDGAALRSAEVQLATLKSPPGNSMDTEEPLCLDLSQIFTESMTSELVSKMLESLKGPEHRHWIQIK